MSLMVSVLVSCSVDNEDCILASGGLSTDTRSVKLNEIDWKSIDTTYFVGEKDVEAYVHFKTLAEKEKGIDVKVAETFPLVLENGTVLGYTTA